MLKQTWKLVIVSLKKNKKEEAVTTVRGKLI